MSAKKPLWKRLAGPFVRPIAALANDLVGIAREMLAIPLGLWLALGELLGRIPLAIWRAAAALALALWRAAAAALAAAERSVTPVRATAAVAAVAALAVIATQFTDYRAVAIGSQDYARVDPAAAPEVAQRTAGSAHAYVLLPVAALALLLAWLALVGRGRLARLIALAGIVVVAVSGLVDAPKGLDEGSAAIQYQGAEATLLGPFWAQLFGGIALIATGALLARGPRDPHAAPAGEAGSGGREGESSGGREGEAPFPAAEPWATGGPREART